MKWKGREGKWSGEGREREEKREGRESEGREGGQREQEAVFFDNTVPQ